MAYYVITNAGTDGDETLMVNMTQFYFIYTGVYCDLLGTMGVVFWTLPEENGCAGGLYCKNSAHIWTYTI